MSNEESHYKRIEDQKWREGIDKAIVLLMSAQKASDEHDNKVQERIEAIEDLLKGDPLKRDDAGVLGDVKDLGVGLNALRAIMAPDAMGNGGIKNRISACEEALGLRVETSQNRWKVLLAVIGATATITTAVVANLDRIEAFWRHQAHTSDPVERLIQKAKHPKSKHRRIVVHQEPADETSNDGVPEMRGDDGVRNE